MSNTDVPHDNDSAENGIESPTDGPTPDWMKMATSSGSAPSMSEDDMPDWLKEIQSGESSESEQEESAMEAEDDPFAGMSDLERLLAEEGVDINAVEEERPAGSEGMSARDWMISTSDDEMIRKRVGEESVSSTAAEEPAAEPEPEDDPFAGMSDLERLLAEEGVDLSSVDEERPAGAEGMSARDWMITTSDDEMIRKRIGAEPIEEPAPPAPKPDAAPAAPAKADTGDDDLPDWLRDMDEESAPVAEAPAPDDKMVVEDDLPDWLRDFGEDELPEPEEAAPVVEAASDEEDMMVVEDDLPDWLRDVDDSADVETAPQPVAESASADADEDDLPDWLRDVEEDVSEPALSLEADDKMVVEDDLPDWLQDFEAEEASKPESEEEAPPAPVVEAASDEEDMMVVEDDLPDWLRDVEETVSEPEPVVQTEEDDLPDWLTEAEEAVSEPVPTKASSAADSMIEEDDLPDWLQEVQDETGSTLFETDAALTDDDIVASDELPDWLTDVPAHDDEPFEPSEPSPEEPSINIDDDLPDWLREVQGEDESIVSEPVAEADDDQIDEDELPDWLRDVQDLDEAAVPEPVARVEVPQEPEPELVAEVIEELESEEELVAAAAPEIVEAEAEVVEAEVIEAPEEPAEEVVEEIPATPEPVAPKPTPSGMPNWLQKLREGDRKPAKPAPEPVAVVPQPVPLAPQPMVGQVQMATAQPQPEPVPVEPDYSGLPDDPDKRLELARSTRDQGNIDEAVRIYSALIAGETHLSTVIEDMELAIRSYPSNYLLYQTMGDAMMREGRLQGALDSYRKALEKLAG